MKRLRKIIFWAHLPIGVIGGLVMELVCEKIATKSYCYANAGAPA